MSDLKEEFQLHVQPEELAICRLAPDEPWPTRVLSANFYSISRTAEELSVVLPEHLVKPDWKAERGWSYVRVAGVLDFNLTGILARLTIPLAQAGISVFAISTFDTDYLLVRSSHLEQACRAWQEAGYEVIHRL